MNLIGKIFVVLILVMSIMFMTVAGVVYATHRNWETLAKARQAELRDKMAEFASLQSEHDELKSKIENQQLVARQQLAKLQSEQQILVTRNASIQEQLDDLKIANRQSTAAVAATQKISDQLSGENDALRERIVEAEQTADNSFTRALAATEQVSSTVGELDAALGRNQVLAEDVGRMRSLLESKGIDPATSVDDIKPVVDGFVSAVRRAGSTRLIEITIGADDGLRQGHTIEIFRGRKYLGRATIRKTDPDRAVGVIDPNYLKGRIQEGDRVATRLKLS